MPATAESLIIPSSPQKTKLPPLAESNIRAPVGVVTPSIARTAWFELLTCRLGEHTKQRFAARTRSFERGAAGRRAEFGEGGGEQQRVDVEGGHG